MESVREKKKKCICCIRMNVSEIVAKCIKVCILKMHVNKWYYAPSLSTVSVFVTAAYQSLEKKKTNPGGDAHIRVGPRRPRAAGTG